MSGFIRMCLVRSWRFIFQYELLFLSHRICVFYNVFVRPPDFSGLWKFACLDLCLIICLLRCFVVLKCSWNLWKAHLDGLFQLSERCSFKWFFFQICFVNICVYNKTFVLIANLHRLNLMIINFFFKRLVTYVDRKFHCLLSIWNMLLYIFI